MYECQSGECEFTSPVIIEIGDILYTVCYVCICSAMLWCYDVSWCYVYVGYGDVLEVFVCILRSCISVLMTCGVLMCVNVVSDLMYVIRPPPCLCSLSPLYHPHPHTVTHETNKTPPKQNTNK